MRDDHLPSDSNSDVLPRDSTTSNSNLSGSESSVALLSIAVVFLAAGFNLLAVVFIAAAIYVRYVVQADYSTSDSLSQVSRPPSLSSSFEGADSLQMLPALNELISVGNVWDSAVNEAIVLI